MKHEEPDFTSFGVCNGSSAIDRVSSAQLLSISLFILRLAAQ
jgi:hypothetical protein